jgi:hypothetical protein
MIGNNKTDFDRAQRPPEIAASSVHFDKGCRKRLPGVFSTTDDFWKLRQHGNLCSNFALFVGAEEALRSVLRALLVFQYLNHLPAASPSPQLHCNVTIAATKPGLARIFIGGCGSVRWPA